MILKQRRNTIDYTQDQLNALQEVDSFLIKPASYNVDVNTFKLAGYAGTGKTTIIENIFTYARDILGLDVYVAAPTNAAVKVLRNRSYKWKAEWINYKEKFRTLHSLLYGEPDEDGNWHPRSSLTQGQLLIIDEASMIDTFVNNDINNQVAVRGAKVIKIGDGFQLEPVGDDPKVLRNPHYELKDVQRHDGVILDYVTKIREIKKSFIPSESLKEVKVLPVEEVGHKWLDDIKKNDDSVFITAKNTSRVELNKLARIHKFGDDPDILKKTDQMIVIANSAVLKNSETFRVGEVIDVFPLEIFAKNGDSFGDCYYAKIEIHGVENELLLFPNTLRPSIYHPEIDTTTLPYELDHLIDKKPYKGHRLKREVLITTYGYAITAHKSQGSQWENVYVHNDFWGDNPRWLYTAASRSTKFLTLSNNSSDKKLEWKEIIKENGYV